MCRKSPFCTELGERHSWSSHAPLPVPDWIREELSRLHDCIRLAAEGDVEGSVQALAGIRSDAIRAWGVEHGQLSGRFRNAELGVPDPDSTPATGPRTASAALRARILNRDGYLCRYCGVRVIPREVLTAYGEIVGQEVFGTGRANAARHGAALVSWAEIDHVAPYKKGGRTEEDNLVASCWACNYGKDRYTVEQLGIQDPRDRQPLDSDWDGLWSLLPRLQSLAAKSGKGPAAKTRTSEGGRPTPTVGPKRRGGKPRFPAVYEVIDREIVSFPELRVSNPNPSSWVYFRPLSDDGIRAAVRYRLRDDWAELVLHRARISEDALRACFRANPIPGADIAARGRTELAVWIPTPRLNLVKDIDGQALQIRKALGVVDTLRRWYVEHSACLTPG